METIPEAQALMKIAGVWVGKTINFKGDLWEAITYFP